MMTPEELTQAKTQLAAMKQHGSATVLTAADLALLKKYPRHTLADARLIDTATGAGALPLPGQEIHVSGDDFQYLQWQESGTPYTRQ